jgi:hypothetical protein
VIRSLRHRSSTRSHSFFFYLTISNVSIKHATRGINACKHKSKHAGRRLGKEGHKSTDLDGLPDGVPVGADDHGAPDGPVVRELGGSDHVRVPGVEVHRPRRHLPFPVPAAGLRGLRRRSSRSRRSLSPGRGGGREPRRRQTAPEQGLGRREQRGEAQQRRHCGDLPGLGFCPGQTLVL